MDVRVHPDSEALAQAVAEHIAKSCARAVSERGAFHWALAGGNTPKRCYAALRHLDMPWSMVHVYFGDERCLPCGHADRNDAMADEALLSHVDIPREQIHRIPAELGPMQAAAVYDRLLGGSPRLDLVLLGMGEDGHTASLFPGNAALSDARLAVPVTNAPKPPPERVSMGLAAIQGTRECIIMAAGQDKKQAFQRIRDGEQLPAGRVESAAWFVDKAVKAANLMG
ncbi:MAG: 6-phosphogluconolactonase [Mariprofundaceae bacterium]